MRIKVIFIMIVLPLTVSISSADGKQVFEKYCWGCHHQTAVAFGPSFTEIAAKRSVEEIAAMITDPKAVSKVLGFKRNAMPKIEMSAEELQAITDYVYSFKEGK